MGAPEPKKMPKFAVLDTKTPAPAVPPAGIAVAFCAVRAPVAVHTPVTDAPASVRASRGVLAVVNAIVLPALEPAAIVREPAALLRVTAAAVIVTPLAADAAMSDVDPVTVTKEGEAATFTDWSNQSFNVGLPESVIVRAASPSDHESVRPAVKTSAVANVRSNAAPDDLMLSPVKELAVPPLIAGVARLGVLANTNAPLPVSSVTAAARLALDGVPSQVATPAPSEVMPVPPLATGRVPLTSVVRTTAPNAGSAPVTPLSTVPVAPTAVTTTGLVPCPSMTP